VNDKHVCPECGYDTLAHDRLAEETLKLRASVEQLRAALTLRERQLSLAVIGIGKAKGNPVIVIYNERGEFVDVIQPNRAASDVPYCEPAKLAALRKE
jgi:hypothetical protein